MPSRIPYSLRPMHRRGISVLWFVGGAAALAVVGAIVLTPFGGGSAAEAQEDAVLHPVKKVLFEHSIVEPGEIESSNNVEVRCEVQSRNSTGTVILEIVPAGTVVQEGDIIIKFDGSALEAERTAQMIICNSSKALVIQSQSAYETALIAKREYLEGTFTQEEQLIESELFVAEETLRRAEETARYTERLAARGFVTAQQVEADKFAVEKARKDVDAAKTKLKVLREFTKEKMVKQLEAAIKTAEAKLRADENTHKLDNDKLKLIEQQLEKCTVRAPASGKVVYANETDRRGNAEVIIQEGAIIRERQVVIRLPDLTQMQVKAKINESKIGFVKVGMPATITLDAFPDLEIEGVVKQADEYPQPPGWSSGNIKQYATYIEIKDPPPGILRPGLTANVEIHVDQIAEAVTVPVQGIHEHKGEYYCLVQNGDRLDARWVEVGSSNDKVVVINSGLNEGDQVVLNPDPFVEYVEFPAPPIDKLGKPKTLLANARAPDPIGMNNGGPGNSGNGLSEGKIGGKDGSHSKGGPGERGPGGEKGRNPVSLVQDMFNRYDLNKDGALSTEEMPAERRDRMELADANGDGKVDRNELTTAMARTRGPRGEGGPPATGGGAQ